MSLSIEPNRIKTSFEHPQLQLINSEYLIIQDAGEQRKFVSFYAMGKRRSNLKQGI